ncbi:hypothetical protein WR25_22424 [Diploscapter pachys]|uniref:ShKT domain-containing protein n=1 Tax=Diploscapter pachys TaxID=2018661 RepID=A0A2A2LUV0_9BILA|nr:hypothetical protein WR25_22424 [Diploscapter pachys]
MHYDGYAFGKVDNHRKIRLATMIPKKSGVELRDNMKFTPTDIKKLNRFGGCLKEDNQILDSTSDDHENLCEDKARHCELSKQRGLCAMAAYRAIMKTSCMKTCDLCQKDSHSYHRTNDARSTRRVASANRTSMEIYGKKDALRLAGFVDFRINLMTLS